MKQTFFTETNFFYWNQLLLLKPTSFINTNHKYIKNGHANAKKGLIKNIETFFNPKDQDPCSKLKQNVLFSNFKQKVLHSNFKQKVLFSNFKQNVLFSNFKQTCCSLISNKRVVL